jgi:hypothetical protein
MCIGHSCLIARNLLSGLKTCMEVANYMYSNGPKIARRSFLNKTALGDFAETEQDYVVRASLTLSFCGFFHLLISIQIRKVKMNTKFW